MSRTDRLVIEGLGRLPQFSHAGLTDDLIFVSGTLGSGDDLTLVEGGVGPETTQTLRNIERILSAAGARWEDAEVVVDNNLVTSRKPEDLPAFCRESIKVLASVPALAK